MRLVASVVPPRLEGLPLNSAGAAAARRRPRWVVTLDDGTTRLADQRRA